MKNQAGFTAVELLITIIVGSLMLLTAYQLYTFVLNDSTSTRLQATASNLAYKFMREGSANAQNPCVTYSGTPVIPQNTDPGASNLPAGSTASVQITCPTNLPSSISYITSSVTYGGTTVTHATYISFN